MADNKGQDVEMQDDVEEIDWDDMPIVSLTDDSGEESRFEMLAVLEVDEAMYAVLTPADAESPEGEPLEIQIMHYEEAEDGSFTLRSIEDEALAAQLFEVVSETLTDEAEE